MKQIPMLDLKLEYEHMKGDIDSAIRRCLEHQKWILGPEVKELEDKIAEYIGVKHCIGVCSGTEALVLSLRALAIKLKGREYFDRTDEIITTPFTFTATGDAILRSGATPIFVDINPTTYNVDPEQIRHAFSSMPSASKVVGIIPVHLYGRACEMDKVMKLALERNLFVVEDVAQAFGGMWHGSTGSPQKLGSIGSIGCFSFFPSKNLGGFGDGGMVSTNDDEIGGLVRMLLKHGGKDKYNVDHIGYNARLDTLQAAVLLAKFKYIDEFNTKRVKIAAMYNKGLQGVNGIVIPEITDGHVVHQYTIRVLNEKRDALQKHLQTSGVGSIIYYPYPLHKMKVFGDGRSSMACSQEHAEQATAEVLSLPVEPLMREDDIRRVIQEVKEFVF